MATRGRAGPLPAHSSSQQKITAGEALTVKRVPHQPCTRSARWESGRGFVSLFNMNGRGPNVSGRKAAAQAPIPQTTYPTLSWRSSFWNSS
jgi:hypothetical protein